MSEIVKALKDNITWPTVRPYGQVTIESDFRKLKNIKPGDKVCMIIIPESEIRDAMSAEEYLALRHPAE